MAATLTGTPTVLQFTPGTQDPAGQSITVPADAVIVAMFWQFYQSAAGHGLASCTLAGNAYNYASEAASQAAGDSSACGVAIWYNPPTGSQTLDPAWDAAPTDPTVTVVFITGGDTAGAPRDNKSVNATGSTALSTTLSCQAGDLVIKYDTHFSGTIPTLTSGWTSAQTETSGTTNQTNRTSYISAAGTSQACAAQEPAYSTISAIAIAPAAAASNQLGRRRLGLSGAFGAGEIGRNSGRLFRRNAGGRVLVPAWSN